MLFTVVIAIFARILCKQNGLCGENSANVKAGDKCSTNCALKECKEKPETPT
jgi:hypothetical protein